MSYIGEAPAKLLLFGEHAAVYGYPAIGVPLPWKIKVSLIPGEQIDPLFDSLKNLFPDLLDSPPLEIKIESDIPIGMGFGSSGALCVALARALGTSLTGSEIWEKAHQLEKQFHSSPSGIDTGISVMESPCYFENGGKNLPICRKIEPLKVPILIGSVPRAANTASLVGNIGKSMKNDPQIDRHLRSLGEIAHQSIQYFNDPQKFADLANQAHSHLQSLNLSSPRLDEMLAQAKELGALGGKLSGAGGGGAFYIVCPNLEVMNTLKSKMNLIGLYT